MATLNLMPVASTLLQRLLLNRKKTTQRKTRRYLKDSNKQQTNMTLLVCASCSFSDHINLVFVKAVWIIKNNLFISHQPGLTVCKQCLKSWQIQTRGCLETPLLVRYRSFLHSAILPLCRLCLTRSRVWCDCSVAVLTLCSFLLLFWPSILLFISVV